MTYLKAFWGASKIHSLKLTMNASFQRGCCSVIYRVSRCPLAPNLVAKQLYLTAPWLVRPYIAQGWWKKLDEPVIHTAGSPGSNYLTIYQWEFIDIQSQPWCIISSTNNSKRINSYTSPILNANSKWRLSALWFFKVHKTNVYISKSNYLLSYAWNMMLYKQY